MFRLLYRLRRLKLGESVALPTELGWHTITYLFQLNLPYIERLIRNRSSPIARSTMFVATLPIEFALFE